MIQKPKGTYDVYGEKGKNILYIENLFKALMEKYNYEYFRIPIFENSNLFHRSVGETTDIISKETYDFIDRGNRNITLRPEGTAGIVRSYIENKLYGIKSMPVKAWYYGSMYRYERPQSGRFREFYQFGVEAFGSNDPMLDAEVISIPVNLFKLVGLKDVKVNINTLGDKVSRENYRQALLNYFKPYLNDLCEDCKQRYEKNPLRILDCKIDSNNNIMKNAPKMTEYLNEESKSYFEKVQDYLNILQIKYTINSNLVRGLDYYTHTIFEVEANIKGFGSQNVLCGGGRYDHLVSTLNGPDTPGVGFALGLERLLSAIECENIKLDYKNGIDTYIIPLSEKEKEYAFFLTNLLRMNGFSVDIDYMNRNIKNNFKQSEKLGSKFIIIIGEEELNNGLLTIKNNQTKEEYKIKYDSIIDFLDEKLGEIDV